MVGLVARRLAQLPVILLVVYTITFLLAWSLPGSAILNDEGRRPSDEVMAALEAQYNLDNPWRFYTQYLADASGLSWAEAKLSGEPTPPAVFYLGPSLKQETWSVNEIIGSSLPVSIVLGFGAMTIAVVVGVTAGVIGAVRPNSWADLSTLALALVGISVPSFVVGTVLLIAFPVALGVGTVGGWGRPGDIVLPALTLSLPFAAYIARLTRMGMIESLSADYVRTARAKGCSGSTVVLKHALKNAFLPVLSYLGPATAFAMTGSFVVETVFVVPGLGQHFVDSVRGKDLFMIMGVTLVFATLLIVFNLVVDIMYRWVDPRIE
jgi:oligopeptide transport system permease protein